MSTIDIRRATDEDHPWIADRNAEMARETEGRALDPAAVRAGVAALARHPERGFYLVAWCDEVRAGTLMVTPEWSDWRNGWFWWIQSVYVVPRSRRRGVYRALHEAVVSRARKQGDVRGIRLYVDEDNANAMQTYRALGMDGSNYRLFEQRL